CFPAALDGFRLRGGSSQPDRSRTGEQDEPNEASNGHAEGLREPRAMSPYCSNRSATAAATLACGRSFAFFLQMCQTSCNQSFLEPGRKRSCLAAKQSFE